MSWSELFRAFVRQASFSLAWFTGLLVVAERLAAGSVTPYINVYWLVFATLVLTVLSPAPEEDRPAWRAIGLLPVAFFLVAFLFLITSGLGRWGLALTAVGAMLSIAFVFAVAYPGHDNEL